MTPILYDMDTNLHYDMIVSQIHHFLNDYGVCQDVGQTEWCFLGPRAWSDFFIHEKTGGLYNEESQLTWDAGWSWSCRHSRSLQLDEERYQGCQIKLMVIDFFFFRIPCFK